MFFKETTLGGDVSGYFSNYKYEEFFVKSIYYFSDKVIENGDLSLARDRINDAILSWLNNGFY